MDNTAELTFVESLEMLDVDDSAVLITTSWCSDEDKNMLEEEVCPRHWFAPQILVAFMLTEMRQSVLECSSILAEKEDLTELGYRRRVQLLQEEIDAARSELERVRQVARIELASAQNSARVELETVQDASRTQLVRQQDAMRYQLEMSENAHKKLLEVIYNVGGIQFGVFHHF